MPRVSREDGATFALYRRPRERNWSAKLTFPDGTNANIKTPYDDQNRARMSAMRSWMGAMKERGFPLKAPNTKAPSIPARLAKPLPKKERALATHLVALTSLQGRINALTEVSKAIAGLDRESVTWIFRILSEAMAADEARPAADTNNTEQGDAPNGNSYRNLTE